jgi:hypothetical protein
MKMKVCVAAALLALGLTGCVNMGGWNTVSGSGNVVTEPREVAGFDRVSVSGAGELTVVQGDEESLTIEADDNLLPLITSEVHHGALSLGPRNVNLHPTRTIVYRLKVKNLRGVDVSGSVHGDVGTLKTDRLDLNISGSGRLNVEHLDAEALSARISGSGNTSASGRADKQQISISGSGNHQARDLKCARADAHISGSGDAEVWVTESLGASISGSGRVAYRGNPSVDAHVSGSGRVRHLSGAE